MSELLTVREAAERLGVAYSTLKQWIYDGSIRTTKTRGGHHRISDVLVDVAAARRDNRVETLPQRVDQVAHFLCVQRLGESSEPGNVGEQNRDLLALVPVHAAGGRQEQRRQARRIDGHQQGQEGIENAVVIRHRVPLGDRLSRRCLARQPFARRPVAAIAVKENTDAVAAS